MYQVFSQVGRLVVCYSMNTWPLLWVFEYLSNCTGGVCWVVFTDKGYYVRVVLPFFCVRCQVYSSQIIAVTIDNFSQFSFRVCP